MPMELRRVYLGSVYPIALGLGAVNGVLLLIPTLWHWLDTGEWITGSEFGPGLFVLGVLVTIGIAAITAAIFLGADTVLVRVSGGTEVALGD